MNWETILTMITSILSTLGVSALGIGQFIKNRQARKDRELELQHDEKVSTIGTNFDLIDQKVLQCYRLNDTQVQMEERVRELIDFHKMNALNQTQYVRHANSIWVTLENADKVNRS